jgi:hypothetical protein
VVVSFPESIVLPVVIAISMTIFVFQTLTFANPKATVVSPNRFLRYCAAVVDKRPPRHARTGKGLIFPALEFIFAFLNGYSISQHGRAYIRRNAAFEDIINRTKIDRTEAKFVDIYIVFVTVLLAILLLLDLPKVLATSFVLYIIIEAIQRTGSVILFDKLRGHPPPADTRRSLIIGIINFFQIVIGFAVIWQAVQPACIGSPESVSIWNFVERSFDISGFGDSSCKKISETPNGIVLTGQRLATMWTLLVVVSYSIGALPSRQKHS